MAAVTTFPPVSGVDSDNYYDKTEVELLIASGGAGGTIDLSNYYKKLETYSKEQVDTIISSGTADLSDYYTKAEVDNLISAIPETDLSNYYNKTEVDNLIPDISTKQDVLVSATNIKTINGESILGSGDLVISGGGTVDLSDYYKKTETYSKIEVDTIVDNIPETDLTNYYNKTETYSKNEVDGLFDSLPETDLSNYYNKTEVDNLIDAIPETDLSGYYNKVETETLLSNKVDKEVGKGLSTNDFTDTFKQALELNKVQNVSTDSVNKKLVVTYTDGTFVDLNLDDVITDVKVEGAVLDTSTNVLTILGSDGGADVIVDLSVFVTNQTLNNALVGKADNVHTHTPAEVDGLDTALETKVDKVEGYSLVADDEIEKLSTVEEYATANRPDIDNADKIHEHAIVNVVGLDDALADKVDKVTGKGLSDENYTLAEKDKLGSIAEQATKNRLDSENADKLHTHTPAEVGLGNVDNTSDEDKPLSRAQSAALIAKFNLKDVAQETGSNASKVMSQKASTEAFYRAGPGVQKAGKIYVQSTEPAENVEEGDIWLKI